MKVLPTVILLSLLLSGCASALSAFYHGFTTGSMSLGSTQSRLYTTYDENYDDIEGKIVRTNLWLLDIDNSISTQSGYYAYYQWLRFSRYKQEGHYYPVYSFLLDVLGEGYFSDLKIKIDGEIFTLENPSGTVKDTSIRYVIPNKLVAKLNNCKEFSVQFLKEQRIIAERGVTAMKKLIDVYYIDF